MGSTGYPGLSAAEAKAAELRGTTTLFRSGNWYALRLASGALMALYLKVTRSGDEAIVKAITVDMGPYEIPQEPFFRRYVALTADEPGYRVTQYEADWRARSEALYAAKVKGASIKVGDTFETVSPYDYNAFGRQRVFTLLDRRRRIATLPGGARVRLPRGWEANVAGVLN